jgi:hypothetical protein
LVLGSWFLVLFVFGSFCFDCYDKKKVQTRHHLSRQSYHVTR